MRLLIYENSSQSIIVIAFLIYSILTVLNLQFLLRMEVDSESNAKNPYIINVKEFFTKTLIGSGSITIILYCYTLPFMRFTIFDALGWLAAVTTLFIAYRIKTRSKESSMEVFKLLLQNSTSFILMYLGYLFAIKSLFMSGIFH